MFLHNPRWYEPHNGSPQVLIVRAQRFEMSNEQEMEKRCRKRFHHELLAAGCDCDCGGGGGGGGW